MDPETHRPREEPENSEIGRDFPADPAEERKGLADEQEVPSAPGGAPREHGRAGAAPQRDAPEEGAAPSDVHGEG